MIGFRDLQEQSSMAAAWSALAHRLSSFVAENIYCISALPAVSCPHVLILSLVVAILSWNDTLGNDNHGKATKLSHPSATRTCQQGAGIRISPWMISSISRCMIRTIIVSLQVINRIIILLAIQFQSHHRPRLSQSLRSSLDIYP